MERVSNGEAQAQARSHIVLNALLAIGLLNLP